MNMTVPASQLVNVNPGVVGAGGTGLVLNGMVLTTSTRVPIGTVASFPNAAAVAAFFGATSPEAIIASTYFLGFANSTIKPGALMFAQYAWTSAVAAYLQSGPVSSLTLAQLQAISGTLIVTIDGVTFTAGSFSLAAATSFSTAAGLIQTALNAIEAAVTGAIAPAIGVTAGTSTIAGTTLTVATMSSGAIVPGAGVTGSGVTTGTTIVRQLTGPAGGAGTYQVSISQTVSATAITTTNAAAGVLTVSAVGSGVLTVGQNLSGGTVAAGTVITGELTGAGSTGTYIVSPSQTASSASLSAGVSAVTYDSVSGSFFITGGTVGSGGSIGYASGTMASALNLTQANGAILSQGAPIATPTAFMNALIQQTQNWFSFATTFDPTIADKLLFASWSNAQDIQFLYAMSEANPALETSSYASTAWGQIQAAQENGTLPIFDPTLATDNNVYAASVLGFFASLDFNRTNGRFNLAYQATAGLTANVNNGTIAAQLKANGLNFYAVYGSANEVFTWWQPGAVSGPFLWADTYAQAVYLKNQLQLAMLTLLGAVGNIPYNSQGASLVQAAALDPITQMINYGGIRSGVTLSALQIAEVNNAAGLPINATLFARGWYLQIGIATAQVRAQRTSPPITLWYTDGQSIQTISIASLVIE